MNESGRKAVTFVFAGYKKEMDEFVQYNAGLESRIKCHLVVLFTPCCSHRVAHQVPPDSPSPLAEHPLAAGVRGVSSHSRLV